MLRDWGKKGRLNGRVLIMDRFSYNEWAWISGFMGPDVNNKKATWHDGGEKIVARSTLERI
jgi:hypothetical protein